MFVTRFEANTPVAIARRPNRIATVHNTTNATTWNVSIQLPQTALPRFTMSINATSPAPSASQDRFSRSLMTTKIMAITRAVCSALSSSLSQRANNSGIPTGKCCHGCLMRALKYARLERPSDQNPPGFAGGRRGTTFVAPTATMSRCPGAIM